MTVPKIVNLALDALSAAGVDYMLTGGLVANVYGVPRTTVDADVVIRMEEAAFNRFVRLLPASLRLDSQTTFEMLTGSHRQIIYVEGSPFQIELFTLGADAHHQERFRRRQTRWLPDLAREAPIATGEDMVIQKLRWNRDKDRDDVRNILGVQGDALDFKYIERWCDEHGTRERLEALRESLPKEAL